MWRKVLFSFLLVFGLFVTSAASSQPAFAQEKSYSAERFDVDVVVQDDGSLLVTETVIFTFVGEPFTFVFRELPTNFTDGITDIVAKVDGRIYPQGTEAGQVEITGRNPIRVEYHFEPTVGTSRTFELQYTMNGVVRQEEDADLLIFQPLPDEYEYPIASSTVAVTYPRAAIPTADPTITAGNATVTQVGNEITFTKQNLSPDEPLVFSLPFESGSLISTAPEWQARRASQLAMLPYWTVGGFIFFTGGIFLIIRYWRKNRAKVPKTKEIAYEAPGKLSPAFVGMLLTPGAEPGWAHALGTLFDLADRGVLQIDELDDKKWYRQHDFMIRLVERPSSLTLHEQAFLDLLFDTKKGWVDEIKMSKLSSQVNSSAWKSYAETLKDEFEAAGYVSNARKEARKNLSIAGVVLLGLMLLMLIPLFIFLDSFGAGFAIFIGSCFLLAMLAFIMSSGLSPLSELGIETAVTWQPFQNYLKQITRKKAAITRPDIFELHMPHVAAFGLLYNWAKRFEKEDVTKMPHYFHTVPGSTNQMAAFVAMSAATQTSSGAAAGAGAAGAGAAGGGASGAG